MTQVFLTSPWVPREWVLAHGMQPRGIWFESVPAEACQAVEAGRCAFAQTAMAVAEKKTDALFIFSTHCDQLRRGYDANLCNGTKRSFLFNLPVCTESPAAEQIYLAELSRLSRFLVRHGGTEPCAVTLAEAMRTEASRRLALLRAPEHLPTVEFLKRFDDAHAESAIAEETHHGPQIAPGTVPLVLVGGPLLSRHFSILHDIERLGARIMVLATEPGERQLWNGDTLLESELSTNPSPGVDKLTRLLAETYLKHAADAYQRPNHRLYTWLADRARTRGARGVVLWHFTWCDLWRAEAQTLKEKLGLPLLLLQAPDSEGEWPRTLNRVEAFLESLR